MKYIGNALSLQMLEAGAQVSLEWLAEKPSLEGFKSVVGHTDTAAVIGVPMNRESVKLGSGDELVVAQLSGGRLPEGATSLPEGFSFTWIKVHVK
jgi:hypothetical protein